MSLQSKAKDAILTLIEKERDGQQIDRAMLKNVLGIFIEVGMTSMENYQNDFETFLLSATAAFYKRKAAIWIQATSCSHHCISNLIEHNQRLPWHDQTRLERRQNLEERVFHAKQSAL